MTEIVKKTSLLLLINLLAWVILPCAVFAADQKVIPQTLYSIADPVGDDKGPGTYKYPINPVFSTKKGHLDLTKFVVQADLQYYYFQLTMGTMDNPWGAPEGFSHQRIAVYIDSVDHQGRTEPLREGAYLEFAANYGWEYLIDIQSWKHSRLYYYTDEKNSQGNKEIEIKVLPNSKTIQARVPRKLIDTHPERWKFYVLVGAQDGLGPDGFRQVLAKQSEWQFGGGTDTYFDPNVVDMLVPVGYQYSQGKMLGSYNLNKGKLAVLYPVVPPQLLTELPSKQAIYERIWDSITEPFTAILAGYPLADYYPVYIAVGLAVLIIIALIMLNWKRSNTTE